MANIIPLDKQVLLKKFEDDKEEVTKAGIIIPATAKEDAPAMGEVIAVGSSELIKKRQIKVGDVVIYAKYSGTDIKVDGVEYILVNVKDILAKVEK